MFFWPHCLHIKAWTFSDPSGTQDTGPQSDRHLCQSEPFLRRRSGCRRKKPHPVQASGQGLTGRRLDSCLCNGPVQSKADPPSQRQVEGERAPEDLPRWPARLLCSREALADQPGGRRQAHWQDCVGPRSAGSSGPHTSMTRVSVAVTRGQCQPRGAGL